MHFSNALKRVLIFDGASCLAMGTLLLLGTKAFSPLFGLDGTIIRGAGIALIPAGLFLLWLGTRNTAPAMLVYAVILGNLLWAAESVMLVGSSKGMTAIGIAFVLVQAGAVATLAALEWLGVRQSKAVTSSV